VRPPRSLSLAAAALMSTALYAAAVGEPRVHRLVRVYDWTNGFPWSYAAGVEQDGRGFMVQVVGTPTAGFKPVSGLKAVDDYMKKAQQVFATRREGPIKSADMLEVGRPRNR
jgi:hypothetical protein